MLEKLTQEQFEACLQQTFQLKTDDGTHEAELSEARRLFARWQIER